MGESTRTAGAGVIDRDRDRTERTETGDMDGVMMTLPVKQNSPRQVKAVSNPINISTTWLSHVQSKEHQQSHAQNSSTN